MDLTRELVDEKAAEYAEEEPLYAVEAESIETLGDAYRSGEYGWRDAMWVVRWYYRRYLGEYPDRSRRSGEEAFGENDFEAVRNAISGAVNGPDLEGRLDSLTTLAGVDVPIASAFLMFIDPETYIVIGNRECAVLADAGHLADPGPREFTTDEYRRYLEICRDLCDREGYGLWTLYRAIWRLGR